LLESRLVGLRLECDLAVDGEAWMNLQSSTPKDDESGELHEASPA
jgi:hypothetical protein